MEIGIRNQDDGEGKKISDSDISNYKTEGKREKEVKNRDGRNCLLAGENTTALGQASAQVWGDRGPERAGGGKPRRTVEAEQVLLPLSCAVHLHDRYRETVGRGGEHGRRQRVVVLVQEFWKGGREAGLQKHPRAGGGAGAARGPGRTRALPSSVYCFMSIS